MIRPLYQNTSQHDENIQKYGCYYIDLLNIYQEVAEHQLYNSTVNAIYKMCNRIKNYAGVQYLTETCYVNDIEGISQIVSGLTGVPVYMQRVKEYEDPNFVIGVFKRVTNSGERVTHFVLLENDRVTVKIDPWFPSAKTTREGVLSDLRFIKARRLS